MMAKYSNIDRWLLIRRGGGALLVIHFAIGLCCWAFLLIIRIKNSIPLLSRPAYFAIPSTLCVVFFTASLVALLAARKKPQTSLLIVLGILILSGFLFAYEIRTKHWQMAATHWEKHPVEVTYHYCNWWWYTGDNRILML